MKRILKYFILILGFCFMLPGMVEASTFTLKEKEVKDGVTIIDILYTPSETKLTNTKIDLTRTNNDLSYKVQKNENSGAVGTCDDFPCTLSLELVSVETTIASITITNTSKEEKTTILTLGGDVTSNNLTAKIKPIKTTEATTTTTQKIKSKEATLSGLTISTGTFDQAFSKDIMEYSITGIKDTVNSINITPTCENNCSWSISCPTGGCSVSNTRKVTLQNGANKVAVNVVSEDESANKTYILNIYRGEVVTSSAYLEELKIKEGKLSPNFDPMVNDYSIEIGMEVEKLDIITTTEDPNAEVVIKGNEKLVEGENTITITITSSDGESKQVYNILVNKIEEEEEKEEKDEKVPVTKVEKKQDNTLLIILLSALGLGLIIVVFLIIFKKKKKKKKNDKNDKNNKPNGKVEEVKSNIEDENTETLNILKETKDMFKEEPKDDIDEALDDLMKTKRLELGDLNF